MFRKLTAAVLTLAMLCCMAVCAMAENHDVTYRDILDAMVQCMEPTEEGGEAILYPTSATVWSQSGDLAGFSFEGSDFTVYGTAWKNTGLIRHILVRLPANQAGLTVYFQLLTTLSGEEDMDAFSARYLAPGSDQATLLELPCFQETVDIVDGNVILAEFFRSRSNELENAENAVPMQELIDALR